MAAARRVGRTIGAVLIIQMIGTTMVNSVLEAPLFDPPGFLVAASSHPLQIGAGIVVSMVTESLYLGIAITALPVFYRRNRALTLWLLALAGVTLALAVVENTGVMSMMSLSEAYAKASATDRVQLETVRGVVAAARNSPHFLARMFDGLTIFVLFAALYRSSLFPRILAGVGLLTALLQITGVAMPIFGYSVIFPMLAPLGLSLLATALWLLVKSLRPTGGQTAPPT